VPVRPATASSPPAVPAPAADGWRSALVRLDVARDAASGQWTLAADTGPLAVGVAPVGADVRRITLPAAPPPGDYQVRVRFVRSDGSKEWCVLFPIGGTPAQLWIGGMSGQASSLNSAPGTRVNPSNGPLVNGVEQELVLTVKAPPSGPATLAVTLDGQPYINWSGDPTKLTVDRRYAATDPAHLGLAVHERSAVEFRDVSWR
ncbi:MAG TPA: hypothetical protein VF796_09575, partial [Humisphaera sp.]